MRGWSDLRSEEQHRSQGPWRTTSEWVGRNGLENGVEPGGLDEAMVPLVRVRVQVAEISSGRVRQLLKGAVAQAGRIYRLINSLIMD